MSKTIEERVKEIKRGADCVISSMKNHKAVWLPDTGDLDPIINAMHISQTKDNLAETYGRYIITCIYNGYPDAEIIAGIMQNEKQNEKFKVDINSVIKSLIQIKSPVNLTEQEILQTNPVIEPSSEDDKKPSAESINNKVHSIAESVKKITDSVVKTANKISAPVIQPDNNADSDGSAGGIKVNDKIIKKIEGKINYLNGIVAKINNNESKDTVGDIGKVKSLAKEVKDMIISIDPITCSEEEIAELNDANASIDETLKALEIAEAALKSKVQVSSSQQPVQVQQSAAAHTEGGFNISNFIKNNQQPVKGPNIPVGNKRAQQPKPTVFPHEICGLNDEQIVQEVSKHFKVLERLPAYALYDLLNNKFLARKMKEFDAKQRSNNPYLTQVNMHEYIDVQELLDKYSLCFTMPCNDKDQIIVVLFNPNPAPDKNGVVNYPLHILKASKTKKQ